MNPSRFLADMDISMKIRSELAFRNARINRIWEGANEINRTTIIGTFLRRMSKGRLKLPVHTPDNPFQMIAELQPVRTDDPETLDAQEKLNRRIADICVRKKGYPFKIM